MTKDLKEFLFITACFSGSKDRIKKYLVDPNNNVSTGGNIAVKSLLYGKHMELIKKVIKHPTFRVDDKFLNLLRESEDLQGLVPQLLKDLYL